MTKDSGSTPRPRACVVMDDAPTPAALPAYTCAVYVAHHRHLDIGRDDDVDERRQHRLILLPRRIRAVAL